MYPITKTSIEADITDNDSITSVSFSAIATSAAEGDDIALSISNAAYLTFDWSTSQTSTPSALAGTDFTAASGSFTALGQPTFNIPTIDDAFREGIESFEIHIQIHGHDETSIVLEADIFDNDDDPFTPYLVTYAYDPFDQLVHRHYDPDGAGGSNPATDQFFSWYAGQINLQFGSASATYPSHRFFWNPLAVDQLFADEEVTSSSAGTVLWALTDQLGTIRDIITHDSQNGTVIANHRVFDSYGNLTLEWNTSFETIFGFTGLFWDDADKLQLNRKRFYDPRTGRFTSEDPKGFGGGDTNLNRYVGNNPTNFIDPSGLAAWNFWKWLYAGDGYASDDVYAAAIGQAGDNYNENKGAAHAVLDGVAMIDPSPLTDTVQGGLYALEGDDANAAASAQAALSGPINDLIKAKKAVCAVSKPGSNLGVVAAKQWHHPWPKYLGGPIKQALEQLPKSVHDAYHSGLDKILPRQWSKKYYDSLSGAAKKQMQQDLAAYTKAFDKKYGTSLYQAMLNNGFPGN